MLFLQVENKFVLVCIFKTGSHSVAQTSICSNPPASVSPTNTGLQACTTICSVNFLFFLNQERVGADEVVHPLRILTASREFRFNSLRIQIQGIQHLFWFPQALHVWNTETYRHNTYTHKIF